MLECGHLVGLTCLEFLNQDEEWEPRCPICRKDFEDDLLQTIVSHMSLRKPDGEWIYVKDVNNYVVGYGLGYDYRLRDYLSSSSVVNGSASVRIAEDDSPDYVPPEDDPITSEDDTEMECSEDDSDIEMDD